MPMKKDRCIHFNGIQNDCCAAGVNYNELSGPGEFARFLRLPCSGTSKLPPSPQVQSTCDKKQLPTDEQIAAYEADIQAYMEKMEKVGPVVAEWRKKLPKGKREVIECPACGGRLHLSQSSYNGHVHGRCETAGCVSWME